MLMVQGYVPAGNIKQIKWKCSVTLSHMHLIWHLVSEVGSDLHDVCLLLQAFKYPRLCLHRTPTKSSQVIAANI